MKQKSNLARCYVVSLSKIDAVEEYISSLIQNKQENEFVDFKQFYYHEDKKYDLIKDIVSFSNEVTSVDKYIVFGIINGSWEPAGIDLSTMPDVSVINDLLHTYVEPFIYLGVLSNMCFFVDGPLAINGTAAWIKSCIQKCIYDVNVELKMANMSPMMVIGLQKSGKLYDYIHLIGSSIRPNSIYCVTDDFRNNYVDFDKTPSSTT